MYCFAPILEVAEVFEMTPFFPTSGQKKMTAHAVISTLIALIKEQLEKTEQQNQNQRQNRVWKKNIESGQFEMNFASHKTLVQRTKASISAKEGCIWSKVQYFADLVILWQALLKICLIYHYKIPNLKSMISHIRHYIKHYQIAFIIVISYLI